MMRGLGGVRARHRKQLVEGQDGCGREAVEDMRRRTESSGDRRVGGQRQRDERGRDGVRWRGGRSARWAARRGGGEAWGSGLVLKGWGDAKGGSRRRRSGARRETSQRGDGLSRNAVSVVGRRLWLPIGIG